MNAKQTVRELMVFINVARKRNKFWPVVLHLSRKDFPYDCKDSEGVFWIKDEFLPGGLILVRRGLPRFRKIIVLLHEYIHWFIFRCGLDEDKVLDLDNRLDRAHSKLESYTGKAMAEIKEAFGINSEEPLNRRRINNFLGALEESNCKKCIRLLNTAIEKGDTYRVQKLVYSMNRWLDELEFRAR